MQFNKGTTAFQSRFRKPPLGQKGFSVPLCIHFPPSPPGDHQYAFCHSGLVLPVLEHHASGITQYILCYVWLLSRSIRLVADISSSFFMAKQHSIMGRQHGFLIRLPIVGHLGCFQHFTVLNEASRNISVQVAGFPSESSP